LQEDEELMVSGYVVMELIQVFLSIQKGTI